MSSHKSPTDENENTVSVHPKSIAPGLTALGMDMWLGAAISHDAVGDLSCCSLKTSASPSGQKRRLCCLACLNLGAGKCLPLANAM